MKSRIVFILLALVLALSVGLIGCAPEEEELYKIGVTQIFDHPALNTIRQGCIDQLDDEGFVEGVNIAYHYRNPAGDMSVAKTIADTFVSQHKDLIIAITTPCTQAMCAAATGTDIPIVFIAVTDPILAGIVPSWEHPCTTGLKITGVSDYCPVRPQLEVIKEICPDAHVLGIIYNPGDESNTKTVNEMKSLAPEFGLEVIEATVATSGDTYTAAMSLVGRADVAWSPMCNTTVAGLEGAVGVCEEYDIPYFVPDPDSVRRGGIACTYYSNEDLGRDGGKKAAQVLKGENPCNIPVTTFENLYLTVNPGAAERMGTTIPQSVLDRASEIVE